MYSLVSQESVVIKDLGVLYLFGVDQLPIEMWDPEDFVGLEIQINEEMFKVRGVEKTMIHISPASPYRHSFGLLI